MKSVSVVVLACCVLFAVQRCAVAEEATIETSVQSDTPLPPSCPKVCSLEYLPVCTLEFCDDFRTFPNDCERRRYNCKNSSKFKTIAKSECVKDIKP